MTLGIPISRAGRSRVCLVAAGSCTPDAPATESGIFGPPPAPSVNVDAGAAVVEAGPEPILIDVPDPVVDPDPECFAEADSTEDLDGDGFSPSQGDCNDCTTNINPAAYDFPGNSIDEDCDGEADSEPLCDTVAAPIDSDSALAAAAAIGLCRMQSGDSWGLVSAAYVNPNGDQRFESAVPAGW